MTLIQTKIHFLIYPSQRFVLSPTAKLNNKTLSTFFRSRVLVFKIDTRLITGDKKRQRWKVKRLENDFYLLRSILCYSFEQCFIPALAPQIPESNWDQKSIERRQKTFSRFLRGIIRHPDICTHPFVEEFVRVDHSKVNPQKGMKEFSKRLALLERELIKNKD